MESVQASIDYARSRPQEVWSITAGITAFWSSLAVSTFTQQRILGISTGTPRPLPTLVGIASVALASLASHHVAISTFLNYESIRLNFPSTLFQSTKAGLPRHRIFEDPTERLDLKYVQLPLHTVKM